MDQRSQHSAWLAKLAPSAPSLFNVCFGGLEQRHIQLQLCSLGVLSPSNWKLAAFDLAHPDPLTQVYTYYYVLVRRREVCATYWLFARGARSKSNLQEQRPAVYCHCSAWQRLHCTQQVLPSANSAHTVERHLVDDSSKARLTK